MQRDDHMTRLDGVFETLKKKARKAFVAYICAGDPTLAATRELVLAFEKCGVDIVELGVPFSDPLADGVVNQRASERALKNNVSLADILRLVKKIRTDSQIPIVLFTYVNPIMKFGIDKFPAAARESGVDGVLALDYPPEEWAEYKKRMDEADIDTISLIAPTSSDERIDMITRGASGFVYYVSRTGVTGERDSVEDMAKSMVEKIKSKTSVPVVVGFGISTPQHVRQVSRFADGVVVGSAIVRKVEEFGASPDLVEHVSSFTSHLTAPLTEGRT
jgi:tryptophan synthase alpha chain